MIMTGLAVAVVALLGWIWLTRGFFPAFLNLACCVAAGAIAFGVWEPLAYMLLSKFEGNGGLGGVVWAVALALPFAVSMAILRAATDAACPANMKFDVATNSIGGGVCGALAGVITSGILILSLGHLRVERDFMGYSPMTQQANGSLKHDKALLVPVDRLTAGFYKLVSNGSLATAEPLAKWYPDLEYVGPANRISFGEGKARNTIAPKDFEVWRRFTVGTKETSLADLLKDDWEPAVSQSVADVKGEQYPAGSTLEGFVLNFQPSAREQGGAVVVGNSQLRLLLEKPGSKPEHKVVYPVSVISQVGPEKVTFGRFRFNVPKTFITSVGGASETRMGFEFVCPPGFQPIALYVKNTRVNIPPASKPALTFDSASARDAAIRSGALFEQPAEGDSPTPVRQEPRGPDNEREMGIMVTAQLPYVLQRGTERGMATDEDAIVEGQETFELARLQKNRGIDRNLRLDQFQTKRDTVLVQIKVEGGQRLTWLGKVPVVESTPAPQLVDTDGQVYEAVGYVFEDQDKYVTYRFNRGQPIRMMADLPAISAQRKDQKLTLVFDVSRGVKLAKFQVGSDVIHEFKPPMPTTER
ncbi:MAG: hypothetical protein L6Q35_12825 [Phycisphaerales bacterium]|nr:hypothetical protein [Phycisphaerales bacterium]